MKRKVWDITVKDNPNRVVMGENDEFYTTDTEAYLVFKLDDESFNPATAVLTLENRNDGSLKNETVDVVDGLIEWEMPQRYIEHFGNWQGQLVYEDTKDGQPELYTSAPFTFVVNAHIGDKKKPSLVEIENWEKFIRDGTELIETWEDLEALREENERQRVLNEQARESAEAVRVANEEERELNEAERISKDSERDSKIEAVGERIGENEEDLEQHKLNYVEEISKKANKQQEDWIVPTLLNGHTQGTYWTNFAYFKDSLGFVYYEGIIDSRNSTSTAAFDFPVGYKPLRGRVYPTNNINVNAEIRTDGSFFIVTKTTAVFSGKFYAGVE